MTWEHNPNVLDQAARATLIGGISCIPNSEGRPTIAAYFCASFITGSDKLSPDEYIEMRANETAKDRIGSMDWKFLRQEISDDKQVIRQIEDMIGKSWGQSVFRST